MYMTTWNKLVTQIPFLMISTRQQERRGVFLAGHISISAENKIIIIEQSPSD